MCLSLGAPWKVKRCSRNTSRHCLSEGRQPTNKHTAMAPITSQSTEENHQELIDQLDIHSIRKPFRNPAWKPAQRRNKNIKQIIGEASRKEASLLATQNNSGISTPVVTASPGPSANTSEPSISQAAQLAQTGASRAPTVTYSLSLIHI